MDYTVHGILRARILEWVVFPFSRGSSQPRDGSHDEKSQFIRKDSDAGKDWGKRERGTTEDEMVGWHHRLNGYEFEQTPRDGWKTGKPGMLQSMGSQSRTRLSNWTTTIHMSIKLNNLRIKIAFSSLKHFAQKHSPFSRCPFQPCTRHRHFASEHGEERRVSNQIQKNWYKPTKSPTTASFWGSLF